MKNNVTDSLNEIFEVSTDLIDDSKQELIPAQKTEPVKSENTEDIDSDYNYARDNIYEVIGKGSQALDYLLELAKASEHPRAFEVVSQLTKTLVDANKDLLDIQKKVKELKKEEEKESPKNVTNALFVGSTADLQKLINGRDNDTADDK